MLSWLFQNLLFYVGWFAGNNPPFVLCGIWLIGLPALSGRFLISVCLPFPLAGRPFHRFTPTHSTLRMSHRQVRVDVSFLLRSQGSRLIPEGTAILHVGGVSSFPEGNDSHTPTRQPNSICTAAPNKHNRLAPSHATAQVYPTHHNKPPCQKQTPTHQDEAHKPSTR